LVLATAALMLRALARGAKSEDSEQAVAMKNQG